MRFPISLVAASILAGVHASPIAAVPETSLVAERASVDDAFFADLKYYAEYSAAAYCPNNSDSPFTSITCSTGNCPDVQAADATSVLEFRTTITDIRGFVSVSSDREEIVLSFRGTNSIRNFITDANVILLPFVCFGCLVHTGFLAAWKGPRASIISALQDLRSNYPTYKIVITGHSLGGAVATLAAAELRKMDYELDLYTYGSPRVGNSIFAYFVSGQAGITARVTHVDDPVPKLPPMTLTLFRHTTPEYWLSTGSATTTDYTPADVKVCEGIFTLKCNAGTLPSLDFDAHRYYFENISICGPPLTFRRDLPTSPAPKAPVRRVADETVTDEMILSWMAADAAASESDLAKAG